MCLVACASFVCICWLFVVCLFLLAFGSPLRGGEGTVDWDTAASNCSTGSCLSNFNRRISSKSSNWKIWAPKARIDKFELDEGFSNRIIPPSELGPARVPHLQLTQPGEPGTWVQPPVSVNKNIPFSASLRPAIRRQKLLPAPDRVLWGLIFPGAFFPGGVFISQTPACQLPLWGHSSPLAAMETVF